METYTIHAAYKLSSSPRYTFELDTGETKEGYYHDFDGDYLWHTREKNSTPFYKIQADAIERIKEGKKIVWVR